MGCIDSITMGSCWLQRGTLKELSYEAQIIVLSGVFQSVETVTLHKEKLKDWVSPVGCVIFIEKS